MLKKRAAWARSSAAPYPRRETSDTAAITRQLAGQALLWIADHHFGWLIGLTMLSTCIATFVLLPALWPRRAWPLPDRSTPGCYRHAIGANTRTIDA